MPTTFALIDCNNFFASCERVFRPHLKNKPVMVLSNNDGCVIARSNEVKVLGVQMGQPYFQCEHLVKKHNIHVFSTNFPLYGDMSRRVMHVASQFTSSLEVYSIDEAFMLLDEVCKPYHDYGTQIRSTVEQWTGIPVSVGMAPTKTLAKVANHMAKKEPSLKGVCDLSNEKDLDMILTKVPVGNIWGVGRRYAKFLTGKGVYTAYDLVCKDDAWIKQHMSICGLRTVYELRGISCIEIDSMPEHRKSILTSRTFKHPVRKLASLQEAIALFSSRCAEKLREEDLLASYVSVFIRTNRFDEENFYSKHFVFDLPQPSNYTPVIIDTAKQALKKIYRSGYAYKQAGVYLYGIIEKKNEQLDFFTSQEERSERDALMETVDTVNLRLGTDRLKFAATGVTTDWRLPPNSRSLRYTTRWGEVLVVPSK